MITEHMAMILSSYAKKRDATQKLLSSIRSYRKKGFELVNTIHSQPKEIQLVWASRLLLENAGVSVGNEDMPDGEFQSSLLDAFQIDPPIFEDANLLLSTVTNSDRLNG